MRLRVPLAFLLLLALGLVAAGCFSSRNSNKTVTDAITIGVGSNETEVLPASGTGGGASSGTTGSTASTGSTSTSTGSTGSTSTGGGGGGADFTAARSTFKNTCGGCHTLKDAGTSGTVGPNLDQLKPDAQTVSHQIANAAPPMPKGLLKGAEADSVAKYVAAVAGKS
jgi:hypothetical protein